jgi:fused signal recognition particle receptor
MAGFFKKLFNRIVGKKEEEAPPPVEEQAALPPPEPERVSEPQPEPPAPEPEPLPEPEPAPEPVIERAQPPPAAAVPEPIAKKVAAKAKAKEPPPKVVDPKKPETKKPEPKKAEAKKPEPKKPEPKKPEPKKPEPKKAEAKKPEPKKPEPKKPEPNSKGKPAAPKPVERKVTAPPPEPPAPEEVVEEIETPAPVHVPAPAVETQLAPEPLPPEPEPLAPEPEPLPVEPEPEPPPPTPSPPPRPNPLARKAAPVPAPAPEPERKGWFSRLKDGLSKSSKSITGSITAIFTKRKLDSETLQELEDTLIQADLGITVAERIIKAVSTGRYNKEIDPEEVKQILASEVAKVLKPVEVPFNFGEEKPFVILVVGVNGSGKTTTIGKLGAIAAGESFKVKFAACDTFRAAAIEQLTVWGKRIGAETISRPPGSDAAGLAFDAMKASQADGTDILFIDTAGRLHNKVYLMDELDKVVRVIKKYDANAPHAVLLVLDATTGQNALAQAEAFAKVAGVTGLIMTKLDGTARGGILVAIAEKFKLPIHAIGVGETIDDLQPFDAEAFSRAIAGLDEKT